MSAGHSTVEGSVSLSLTERETCNMIWVCDTTSHANLHKVSLSYRLVDEAGGEAGWVEGSLHNCCITITERDPWLNDFDVTARVYHQLKTIHLTTLCTQNLSLTNMCETTYLSHTYILSIHNLSFFMYVYAQLLIPTHLYTQLTHKQIPFLFVMCISCMSDGLLTMQRFFL